MIRVGLIGYGRAGSAVAEVLRTDPRFELCWVLRQSTTEVNQVIPGTTIPVVGMHWADFGDWLNRFPVDAVVDFSVPEAIVQYGSHIRTRGITLVSAISAYNESQLSYAKELGRMARVLCSPNITLGINFLIVAAKLLRHIAPFADVEILEQHFREKTEVSGTAKKIAASLEVHADKIVSMRLGGIVGHHEVIFGFPYQTVRLTHDSIRREAFGTGVAFALSELSASECGFYTFEDLLLAKMRAQILSDAPAQNTL